MTSEAEVPYAMLFYMLPAYIDAPQNPRERQIRLLFQLSVWGKGLVSFMEVVAGVAVIFIPLDTVTNYLIYLAQGELVRDPDDPIATVFLLLMRHLEIPSSAFIAVYLLSRGIVKLGLVVALLKEKLWAYPVSMVVLGLFILYQTYQIVLTHSIAVVALTVFDLIVVWFIMQEYKVLKRHLAQFSSRA